MESDKIEQMNKKEKMLSIRKICNVNHCGTVREMGGSIVRLELEIKKFKQQNERDHNIICELNNDNIILKQQNAELMKLLKDINDDIIRHGYYPAWYYRLEEIIKGK